MMLKTQSGQDVSLFGVMNAIRNDASPSYKDRIPEVNDENFKQFATGLSVATFFNEWADALINRIGLTVVTNKAWENPLAYLKRGTLEYGESVQEIYTALIDAQKWESETTEKDAGKIFKTEKPDVYSAYHIINREDFYPVSYNEAQISKAFVSPRALEEFILGLWERLVTSDQLDEYLYMKELVAINDEKGLFHYITVEEPENLNELIVQVRATANKFTYPSDKYNGMGVVTHCPKSEQLILISSELDARIDVTVLASAFNMNKAEFLSRRIVLDDLGVDGALLALVSRDWYMVYDKLRRMTEQPNARTLEMKYFYHVHQLISTSRFENAVLFTTKQYKTPDKVEIIEGADGTLKVNKGQFFTLTPKVTAGGVDTDVNQAVIFQLSGNVPNTKVEGNRLYVDPLQVEKFDLRVRALHNIDVFTDYAVELVEGQMRMTMSTPEPEVIADYEAQIEKLQQDLEAEKKKNKSDEPVKDGK